MKRIILITVALLLIAVQSSLAGVIQPARLKYLDGEVLFRMADADEWSTASINTPLDEGDTVWCPEGSRAEIQLSDGSLVRLDGGSQLNIIANEDQFIHLNLASGRLYVRTRQSVTTGSLQIDADDTTVLPAERTRLRLDMLPDGQEDVSIFKGSAYVEGNGSRTRVRAGEHIALEDGHSELLPLKSPDRWENWNMERDRALSVYAKSGSYLPEELVSYSGELESSGSWERVPEYGMVWRPTVLLADDWAPYRYGYWGWRGGDYVWISAESWGWVPYHYGRWTVIGSIGWCWVPPARGDVYWGPGYVGWYRTGNHVGWTPLAPGEKYYGYGHYGRHSVNLATTIVNSSTIEYRNRHHRGGVTVLNQNDFLKGRHANVAQALNSSVSGALSVGSPRIRPQREGRMPASGLLPSRPAPRQMEQKDMRELRQRFPRVINTSPDVRKHPQQTPPEARKHPQQTPPDARKYPQQTPPDVRKHPQQPPPVAAPQQREQHPVASPPVRQQTVVQPAEKNGGQPPQRGQKQRRTWRVKLPESAPEREPRVIEQRGRERKEK